MKEKPLTAFMNPKKAAKDHKEKPAEPKVAGLKGPWELPEGWKWVRISDIADDTERVNPTKNPEMEFLYVDIASIDNVTYQITKPKRLKGKEAPTRARKLIRVGDVIFATTRPYLKNVAIVPDWLDNQVCSTGFAVLRAIPEEAIPKWLFYYLISDFAVEQIRPMMRGANYPAITDRDLFNLKIPLPPLSEQKRIVAKLDEISRRLEEAKRLAREAREEAERLMASALHEVFSKVEEKGWEWVRLGKIAELKAGGTPSRRVREYWKNGTIPWVKISDIPDSGLVEKTEEKITELGLKNSSAKLLPPGTILFSIFATISKVGILKISATTNQAIVGIIPKITIDQKYLFYSLKYFGQELVALGRGGVQDNINKRMLAKLKTPLPPLEEQQRIVAYLDSINERTQKLVSLYEEREKELEQLFPAVLDRAFRGEL